MAGSENPPFGGIQWDSVMKRSESVAQAACGIRHHEAKGIQVRGTVIDYADGTSIDG
jgi:hypothetical protein